MPEARDLQAGGSVTTDVLPLGHPGLRLRSAPVDDADTRAFRRDAARLQAVLAEFRAAHGFGRAVSAPQIGVARRFIAVNVGDGPFLVINPEITWRSSDTFTLWDDCMSFPSLLVRLERHSAISLRYHDEHGRMVTRERLGRALSELLQHEIDHLDGVLAIDRALDKEAIITRDAFEAMPERFRHLVDYTIT